MGKGIFCWEGIPNETVMLSDFSCKKTNHTLPYTGIWCITKEIKQIYLKSTNKTYDNLDAQETLSLELKTKHIL